MKPANERCQQPVYAYKAANIIVSGSGQRYVIFFSYPSHERTFSTAAPSPRGEEPSMYKDLPSVFSDFYDYTSDLTGRDLAALAGCHDALARVIRDLDCLHSRQTADSKDEETVRFALQASHPEHDNCLFETENDELPAISPENQCPCPMS